MIVSSPIFDDEQLDADLTSILGPFDRVGPSAKNLVSSLDVSPRPYLQLSATSSPVSARTIPQVRTSPNDQRVIGLKRTRQIAAVLGSALIGAAVLHIQGNIPIGHIDSPGTKKSIPTAGHTNLPAVVDFPVRSPAVVAEPTVRQYSLAGAEAPRSIRIKRLAIRGIRRAKRLPHPIELANDFVLLSGNQPTLANAKKIVIPLDAASLLPAPVLEPIRITEQHVVSSHNIPPTNPIEGSEIKIARQNSIHAIRALRRQ